MTTASGLLSRRDLDFMLDDWLGVASLLDRPHLPAHGQSG
jgi:hypothetical protein